MDKESVLKSFLTIADLESEAFSQKTIDEKFIEQLEKVQHRQSVSQHLIGSDNEILATWASLDAVGVFYSLKHSELPNRYIGVEELPKFCACPTRSFRKALKELEELGFLVKKKERKGAKYQIKYILYSCPSKKTIANVINGDLDTERGY